MAGQIISDCGTKRPLTGKGRCDKTEGLTDAIILTASDALYPIDPETFKDGLEGWVSDTGVLRMMPIKEILNDTPTGFEINTSQVGYGPTTPVNLSAYNDIFQIDGGLCLYKELANANTQEYRVFRIDKQGYIYGTVVTRNGVDYFAGFKAKVYAYTTKDMDQTTSGGVFLGVYYMGNYENEMKDVNAFKIDQIPEGLIGVTLKKGATAGTAQVVGSCGGDDYTTTYGAQWQAEMFIDSSGANPTNVVYDANTGLLTFTPSGGSYRVASAAVLAADDIIGLEGINQLVNLT